jgi:hypothetical protein
VLQPPGKCGNLTNYRDILSPYEIGIGAYASPYDRANRNHKKTYEFLIQVALLSLVHSTAKIRPSPPYTNDYPLMTFLSSNLKNDCWVIHFLC